MNKQEFAMLKAAAKKAKKQGTEFDMEQVPEELREEFESFLEGDSDSDDLNAAYELHFPEDPDETPTGGTIVGSRFSTLSAEKLQEAINNDGDLKLTNSFPEAKSVYVSGSKKAYDISVVTPSHEGVVTKTVTGIVAMTKAPQPARRRDDGTMTKPGRYGEILVMLEDQTQVEILVSTGKDSQLKSIPNVLQDSLGTGKKAGVLNETVVVTVQATHLKPGQPAPLRVFTAESDLSGNGPRSLVEGNYSYIYDGEQERWSGDALSIKIASGPIAAMFAQRMQNMEVNLPYQIALEKAKGEIARETQLEVAALAAIPGANSLIAEQVLRSRGVSEKQIQAALTASRQLAAKSEAKSEE